MYPEEKTVNEVAVTRLPREEYYSPRPFRFSLGYKIIDARLN